MVRREILENLKKYICNFSWYNEVEFQELLYLEEFDVVNQTISSYAATNILDYIYKYAMILEMLDVEEINELLKLTYKSYINVFDNVKEVIKLSRDYVDEIDDTDLVLHPVSQFYNSLYEMSYFEQDIWNDLEEYLLYVSADDRQIIYDYIDEADNITVKFIEDYFDRVTKKDYFLALINGEEEVLKRLYFYARMKLDKENGYDAFYSEVVSRMMAYLYRSSNKYSMETRKIYNQIEKNYVLNKSYLNKTDFCQNQIDKYKENM